MNPWEIPAEAVIYSRAKESMRSGSGPRLSIRHGTHAKQHQVCNLSEGVTAIGWIIQRLIAAGEQSGLQTHIPATAKHFVVSADQNLAAFGSPLVARSSNLLISKEGVRITS